ncbi:MAG TPA: cytochrome c-type biogenesis CcmF C-terminal domain-containing protein [Acidobacteriota bacterium]|nr:cytochrome c-type biogenesis CcmF C-terminal domain-containing protein [Acidobacteriota bacterium]HNT17058.1 cytochrome c-type biogenesis CcmF C-terminal domain-containing protein [Acidobacteriota bacterium]HQO19297.1 cytochrome c-type biogenesis CcmF C-terminal domain-containing protein [Acidobacteriota bacterium]HQQ46109.1 cytochrome c-type biogenesis CcmF C-terminal domain-containing protein [Acidobacteriota bacterium]
MRLLGLYSLYFAHALALWGVVVAVLSVFRRDERALKSAERTAASILALTSVAALSLVIALVRDDFTIRYVYEYSRRAQPLIYKLTALWGGMDGSLLFWEWILSLYALLALKLGRAKMEKLIPFSSLVLFLIQGFFLFLLSFRTNPFDPMAGPDGSPLSRMLAATIDGSGLNPLLQNFYMAVHPPLLYLGLVAFAVPFALVLAVLFERDHGTSWMPVVRSWSLFSWITLGLGIIFGSYWAYIELGWGGYWAWDPVENASLLPWLTGTAFLHSLYMERKRGLFRKWSFFLVSATFILTIYGTYLTRSGVLQSVHSFGQEDPSIPWYMRLGTIFLFFMAMILFTTIDLFIARREFMKPRAELGSASGREGMVLYSLMLFSLFAAVVFYGVTSPIFYRMFTGVELFNGPEFYNAKAVPVTLMLLLVMALGTAAPWKKGGQGELKKALMLPALAGLVCAAAGTILLYSRREWWQVLSGSPKALFYFAALFALSAFSFSVIGGRFLRKVREEKARTGRTASSLASALRVSGGNIVHAGVIIFCIGVAFSSMFQQNFQEEVKIGESFKAGNITLTLSKLDHDDLDADISKVNDIRIRAIVDLSTDGRRFGTLVPMRVHYKNTISGGQPPAYEAAIRTSLFRDVYAVMSGFDIDKGTAVLTVFINPLVAFLWIGGLFIILGGFVAFLPRRGAP